MAVKRIVKSRAFTASAKRMVEEIRAEMRRPESSNAPKNAPLIVAEDDRSFGHVNYYVIWDAFKSVDHETRTRIVLSAVELEKPKDYKNISIALGLTRSQAEQLGIEFMAMVAAN